MTAHRKLVAFDAAIGLISFDPSRDVEGQLVKIQLEDADKILDSGPLVGFKMNRKAKGLTLVKDGQFLCAEPNRKELVANRTVADLWETFIPVEESGAWQPKNTNVAALHAAATAWDVSFETIDQINARIHDSAPISRLADRADGYIGTIRDLFPYIDWDVADVLEIGSGVGFIMEALERATRASSKPCKITGLDISQSMIDAAKERLAKGTRRPEAFAFAHYDGVTIPFPDESFDLVCSVAALQHVPKPFVYNLFFEIKRILRPNGYAVLHFLSFSDMRNKESHHPWRHEVQNQISLSAGPHWHHYYSKEELYAVLKVGTGFHHVDVRGNIFACVRKTPVRRSLWSKLTAP